MATIDMFCDSQICDWMKDITRAIILKAWRSAFQCRL